MGMDAAARVRSAQGSMAERARKERREKELEGMAGILPEYGRNFTAFDAEEEKAGSLAEEDRCLSQEKS